MERYEKIIDDALSKSIFGFVDDDNLLECTLCAAIYDALDERNFGVIELLLSAHHRTNESCDLTNDALQFDVGQLTHFLLKLVATCDRPHTLECVEVLLNHGADPFRLIRISDDVPSIRNGTTILLEVSAKLQDEEVTILMLDSIVDDVDVIEYARSCWGFRIARAALARGHYALLKRLIVMGFEMDSYPVYGSMVSFETYLREGVQFRTLNPIMSHIAFLKKNEMYGGPKLCTDDVLYAMLDLLLTSGKDRMMMVWSGLPDIKSFVFTHHQRV